MPPAHLQLPAGSSHPQFHCQGEWRPAQLQTCESFTGHIFSPNFSYAMDIGPALTPEIMPSRTDRLGMEFLQEAQKSLQARWILWLQQVDQVFAGSSSLLVLPGSPQHPGQTTLPRCPGWKTNDLSAQPHHFPAGLLGEVARIQFLRGQVVPPAHSETHPLPHACGHHVTCNFSYCPLLGQHPGPQLAGTCKETTSAFMPHPPALVKCAELT